MNASLLELLRCPFCGVGLRLAEGASLDARGEVAGGVLYCSCCTYPVVAGIPYLRTGRAAQAAMRLLGEGAHEEALCTLLEVEAAKRAAFTDGLRHGRPRTFREALDGLSPEAEGTYLLYRFSDPTFLCAQAVLRAVSRDPRCAGGRVLDLCGGAGHLTRSLCGSAAWAEVILADLTFWKLWLAKRFLAPSCEPVCCNANEPLPFARGAFSLVACSDAFHYVWSRRLLADEMLRLIGAAGAVVLPHLHNALCENPSAGMPLAPADYRALFEDVRPRLLKESAILEAVLGRTPPDLSGDCPDADLSREPALALVGVRPEGPFPSAEGPAGIDVNQRLAVNPLYAVGRDEGGCVLRLRFPSPFYEEEYAACKRYLPPSVRLDRHQAERLSQGRLDDELSSLAERHVLLDLPGDYV